MKTSVQDTSINSYYSMPNEKKQGQADRIEAVVKFLCTGTPGADCSLREIKRTYDARYKGTYDARGKMITEIDVSTVSARVNELIAAVRLFRPENYSRKCSISGETVHPVKLPSAQFTLFQ